MEWKKADLNSLDSMPLKGVTRYYIKYNDGKDSEIGNYWLIRELLINGWQDVYYLDEIETTPAQSGDELSRDSDTKYTYYKIEFDDWSEEFDYTIVESLEDILEYLKLADIDLDDPERKTVLAISGIAMTPNEFKEWQIENKILNHITKKIK